jgi:uncharacterized membrane protein YhhN
MQRSCAAPQHFIDLLRFGGTMEATNAAFMTFGLALLLVSWVLLLIQSWQEDYTWGLCTLLLPPLSYLYALFRLDKAGSSIGVAVLGWLLLFLAS